LLKSYLLRLLGLWNPFPLDRFCGLDGLSNLLFLLLLETMSYQTDCWLVLMTRNAFRRLSLIGFYQDQLGTKSRILGIYVEHYMVKSSVFIYLLSVFFPVIHPPLPWKMLMDLDITRLIDFSKKLHISLLLSLYGKHASFLLTFHVYMVKEVTPSNKGGMQLHTGIDTKTHSLFTLLQRKWQLVKYLPFSKQCLTRLDLDPGAHMSCNVCFAAMNMLCPKAISV
jgi:hypothetical protein